MPESIRFAWQKQPTYPKFDLLNKAACLLKAW